ncbi:hypothetical protein [Flavobacterium cerinum]|uniref:Uncharacterized protein n=1 Tax=Flavobacterium cerinum TaxID=2502784 RepID=A0ABY5IVA3_9FLAO|nr:hypothetical protein [Flavobacterium cerinum]UUC46756.1 hypothetical protein NOX80_06030 [Flavobacterium cerinum]
MSKVRFEYILKYSTIKSDKENLDIAELSLPGLKKIAFGKIVVFFAPKKEYILLETGIIDYLEQFRIIIKEIDSGNHNPFSVSSDWYSNSLKYFYDKKSDKIRILESNDNEFDIMTDYTSFKKAYSKFRENTIKDIIECYPELKNNEAFNLLIRDIKSQK